MSKTKPTPQAQSTDTGLPEGWAMATLGQLVSPSKKRIEPGGRADTPYISLEHIESGTARLLGHGLASSVASTKAVFRAGDVLYGKLRPYLNKVCIPDFDGICSTEILVFSQSEFVHSRYLLSFLMLPSVVDFANHNMSGVQLPRIGFEKLAELEVPLPPIDEQKRIAAKVEALLECANAARARLANVPAIIKRFRQSVLAAACSGQLTAEWREGNDLEAADQLLVRLRSAGSTKADLAAEFPVKRWRVIDVRQPQLDELPSIPEAWAWVYLPDVGYMNRGRSRNRPRNAPHLYGGLYPFLQTGDVAQSGGRIVKHRQTYNEAGLAQSRLWPAGTICITIAANIADSAILTYPACFPDSVVGLITDPELCVAEFAEFFIRTARENLSQFAPATAQKNINIGILNEVAVPLPPLAEQREIVRRVEALFALADGIEGHVRAATGRAERLPDAILARAFRGELVATEAELAAEEGRDYEPASVLLRRIVEGREHQGAKRGRGGKDMARRETSGQPPRIRRPLDEVLREAGKPLTPERLFHLAGFDEDSVDGFYEQLRKLIEEGQVRENRPNKTDVTVEVMRT